MPDSSASLAARKRNRRYLLLIAAIFFVPMLVAGVMRFTDVHPAINRQKGELLSPPTDLRGVALQLKDGSSYPWSPAERHWRILAVPSADCRERCDKLAHDLDIVWQALGHSRDHADVLWAGAMPAGAPATSAPRAVGPVDVLKARLPRAEAHADAVVYVVDPNGFVVLRYAPGFDPADLRTDLSRLLKLQ